MKAITVSQAKAVDAKATQKIGISTLVMMENAGIRIADFILRVLKKRRNKRVAVFCGKGNNAGDGLVVSRQLLCEKINVDTFLLSHRDTLSCEAKINLDILRSITKNIYFLKNGQTLERLNLSSYGLLVDAIFGIGLKGKVEGIFKSAIKKINSSRITVVSVDIPSGLDADTGSPHAIAVRADYTVSLIAVKKGLRINQGPKFRGRLIARHIGFPYLVR